MSFGPNSGPFLVLAAVSLSSLDACDRTRRREPKLTRDDASTARDAGEDSTAALAAREQTALAKALMLRFAERTAIGPGQSGQSPRRYLWTDAFATCNLLGLARTTGEERYTVLALSLVDRVHGTLGRHRPDDTRVGWLSGLGAEQGEEHPTLGGLRIGKPLAERKPSEPVDEELEWDRDGQYFHYLTRWMHALDQVACRTTKPNYNVWARELMATAERAFVYAAGGGGRRRMYWKMSIDLSRPLVRSMGQHDALDGYVSCLELDANAEALGAAATGPRLDTHAARFAAMIDRRALRSSDPLGIGGLLIDAYRLDRLARQGRPVRELADVVLDAALAGLRDYSETREVRQSAERRLGFRELGLAIGLAAVLAIPNSGIEAKTRSLIEALGRHKPLGDGIVQFWSSEQHQRAKSWTTHLDINEVMLATALAPEGFLGEATACGRASQSR